MNSGHQTYDFIIVGAGAAGLQLALAMVEKNVVSPQRKLLIVEQRPKTVNDRTWCHWSKENGKWESLIQAAWSEAKFITTEGEHRSLDLVPYTYKMIRGIDFYHYAFAELTKSSYVEISYDTCTHLEEIDVEVKVHCLDNIYTSKYVFDSRVERPLSEMKKFPFVWQHFVGWFVRFESSVFDANVFTIMDFSIANEGRTGFMYVLPIENNYALFEYTYFDAKPEKLSHYQLKIQNYLSHHFPQSQYQLVETEEGQIPMTTYPFHKTHTARVTKIGTAGGWVRPCSGYGWKFYEKHVDKIVDNIQRKKRPSHGLRTSKVGFMDAILLKILVDENNKGPEIFSQMYHSLPPWLIFKFLDGETSWRENLRVITAFRPAPFLRSVFRLLIG